MRVRKRITIKKAASSFLLYATAVGGALATIEIPDGDLSDKVLLTLGVSTAAAILRAVNNVRKTAKKPTDSGYGGVYYVLAAAGFAGLLSGCVTTTLPDGTVIQRVDDAALREAYDVYERERARREAAGQNTDELAVYVDGLLWDGDAIRRELARYGIELPE